MSTYQAKNFLNSLNADRGSDFKKRRRSPTPEPLGEITPLHLRKRKLNFWDERPKGYENMSAEEVKATGMFLLPCHLLKGTGSFSEPLPQLGLPLYQNTIDYQVQSEAIAGRNTKRLYVGGLPEEVEQNQLVDFINEQYEKAGLDKAPGKPALAAVLNKDKKSGLVEVFFVHLVPNH
jgi:splicing factor U2AF subunit